MINEDKLISRLRKYRAVLMCGIPGSGKSYWAQIISDKLAMRVFGSDDYRKKLFGTQRFDSAGHAVISTQSKLAYERMYDDAVKAIVSGEKVILDATHLKDREAGLVKLKKVTNQIVALVVNPRLDEIEKRMSERLEMANESENEFEAWKRVSGYFADKLESGEYSYPSEQTDKIDVIVI